VSHIATLVGYVASLVAHVAALMSHVATLVAHVASLALPCLPDVHACCIEKVSLAAVNV
jgi:hypothetical protein